MWSYLQEIHARPGDDSLWVQWRSQPALWEAVVWSCSPSLVLLTGFSPATQACTIIWPVQWKTGELMFWSSWLREETYSKQGTQPQEFVHTIVWPAFELVTVFGKGKLASAFHCLVMSMWKRVAGSQCFWSRRCCWKLCPGGTVQFQILRTLFPWVLYKTLLVAPEFSLT